MAEEAPTRLLYVDDDEAFCALVRRSLRRRGFDVTCAHDGASGVSLARDSVFDVIAVDHYMPGQDGLQTLSEMLQREDPPPIVFVSGNDDSRVAVAALKSGAADYVVKSSSEEFLDLLAAALGGAVEQVRLRRARDAAEQALRQANSQLEQVVARQTALLREVNHRVANSLQLVSSLVHLQAGALKDGPAREALRDTQARLDAIMQVHRRLYTSEDVETVEVDEYLRGLVAELEQSISPARSIRLEVDPLRLATDKAVSLGVIVNELITNAVKYAYDPGQAGEVRIGLWKRGDRLELRVEDDGRGLPEGGAAPKGTGLGQRVIAAMAKSLGSQVRYEALQPGVSARLLFRP